MAILTIDPGFKRMGFCVFDDYGNILEHGVYSPRDKKNNEKMQDYLNMGIQQVYKWFDNITTKHKVNYVLAEIVPPVSSSEGYKGSPQMPLVFSILAVCKIIAFQKDIEWEDISARTVKKIVAGDASASKSYIRRLVLDEYPEIKNKRKLTEIPLDETDAIAIGMAEFFRTEEIMDDEERD